MADVGIVFVSSVVAMMVKDIIGTVFGVARIRVESPIGREDHEHLQG